MRLFSSSTVRQLSRANTASRQPQVFSMRHEATPLRVSAPRYNARMPSYRNYRNYSQHSHATQSSFSFAMLVPSLISVGILTAATAFAEEPQFPSAEEFLALFPKENSTWEQEDYEQIISLLSLMEKCTNSAELSFLAANIINSMPNETAILEQSPQQLKFLNQFITQVKSVIAINQGKIGLENTTSSELINMLAYLDDLHNITLQGIAIQEEIQQNPDLLREFANDCDPTLRENFYRALGFLTATPFHTGVTSAVIAAAPGVFIAPGLIPILASWGFIGGYGGHAAYLYFNDADKWQEFTNSRLYMASNILTLFAVSFLADNIADDIIIEKLKPLCEKLATQLGQDTKEVMRHTKDLIVALKNLPQKQLKGMALSHILGDSTNNPGLVASFIDEVQTVKAKRAEIEEWLQLLQANFQDNMPFDVTKYPDDCLRKSRGALLAAVA